MRALLARIIPEHLKVKIKHSLHVIDCLLMRVLSSSRVGAALYYLLFNTAFLREQQSTLRGRISHLLKHGQVERGAIRLRRNIHRIEKGLIMNPRKPLFATDYIHTTIDDFERYILQPEHSLAEKKWIQDVLATYFDVVTQTQIIKDLKARFEACYQGSAGFNCEHDYVAINARFIPYAQSEQVNHPVNFESFMSLVKSRRSTRWFLDKPVEIELIKQAISAASYAPSACNRQPYHFKLTQSLSDSSALLSLAMGTNGFGHQVPVAIAVIADLSAYEAERDRHLIYIDASLAAMQFMLALQTLGLSSCPINWPDIEFRERKISQLLKLSNTERVIMLIACGYPDPNGSIPYSHKRSAEELTQVIERNTL